jgi:hypothetical protein
VRSGWKRHIQILVHLLDGGHDVVPEDREIGRFGQEDLVHQLSFIAPQVCHVEAVDG